MSEYPESAANVKGDSSAMPPKDFGKSTGALMRSLLAEPVRVLDYTEGGIVIEVHVSVEVSQDLVEEASATCQAIQDRVCNGLESVDGGAFQEDLWEYPTGQGGGRTRVLSEGGVFEKAGVNFSDVRGQFPEDFAKTMPGEGLEFRATGVSLVLHPRNPMVPTVHANIRCIWRPGAMWFGGGADLTPYFPFREDCVHFHQTWKTVCERHAGVADYPRFKDWCDKYFFLPHRNEARGVGGIFFDHLASRPAETFAFVKDVGESFLKAYRPIVERRRELNYTDERREFQRYRRGRYVEFNLVHDRGTLFGLKTGGRTASILMSLPPHASWPYRLSPKMMAWEAELLEFLRPQDWA
jgi:coproporphyrinogen III oxidase